MRLPGGIRIRIALVLVGIVALALGTAYLIVVPSLERRLVDARLDQLEHLAVPLASALPEDTLLWQDRVDAYADVTNSRVVAFDVLSRSKPALQAVADSRPRSTPGIATNPIALEALASGAVGRGREVADGEDNASVAVSLRGDTIVLFQAPLADSLATVRLVEQRLLLATAFALILALVLGLTAAGMFANRLLRLETAAERIADGDFGAPIVDRGNDEIGELAGAFDRMRVQLAELDNARKAFVANASHELRTPLFSIGGFLELLVDEELDEETRRGFIETMQGQVQRLAKLSTDLLDLSRVDAGQMRVLREPVDLAEVVELLESELEHVAAGTGHVLETEIEPVWCSGDEGRVLQIGRALTTNALVHTPVGTHVVIRCRRQGERAHLSVEDDGPGIPTQYREAVFGRFYRVDGSMASGSGLGLSIARELAKLMGGAVRLVADRDPTVFTLDLPWVASPERSTDAGEPFPRENETRETERVPGS
jgi:signal transduction histidine kinase